MSSKQAYDDFVKRITHLISKNPHLIEVTLSNIFTMRFIGNKTHGDMAEIAITEFINQFMYDFKADHVGKNRFRAKKHEEDIEITNEIDDITFPISLKAYGVGPLQLSTDKDVKMFPELEKYRKKYGDIINNAQDIKNILEDDAFSKFGDINVLSLIYNEKQKKCNILVFNFEKAKQSIKKIEYLDKESHPNRKHPVFRFYSDSDEYICEVRYGDKEANALQRGLWTHTRNAITFFNSVTGKWIDYKPNKVLTDLFSHVLISTVDGHKEAIKPLKLDIEEQKHSSSLR